SAGMQRMRRLMREFRSSPPRSLGGIAVKGLRDYLNLTITPVSGSSQPLDAPRGDMVILDLTEEGHYVAVRPSGTEPKVKFYLFTLVAPERLSDLDQSREEMDQRLTQIETDLRAISDAV